MDARATVTCGEAATVASAVETASVTAWDAEGTAAQASDEGTASEVTAHEVATSLDVLVFSEPAHQQA